MAGVLVFNAADVLPLVQHSLSASEWVSPMREPETATEPSVVLVADQGVYLVSGGRPGLARAEGKGSVVAYAKGLQPRVDPFDDWYDGKVAIVGGDDFAEALPWARDILEQIESGAQEIRIKITADAVRLLAPRKPRAAVAGGRA